eukprot:6345045-Amphidinium_carterae.1
MDHVFMWHVKKLGVSWIPPSAEVQPANVRNHPVAVAPIWKESDLGSFLGNAECGRNSAEHPATV